MQYPFVMDTWVVEGLPSLPAIGVDTAGLGLLVTVSISGRNLVFESQTDLTKEEYQSLGALVSAYVVAVKPPVGMVNSDGRPIQAPTFEDILGMDMKWKGHKYNAQPGMMNCFDVLVTTELRLRGGWYEVINSDDVADGDYVEFSVVDKDDTLGLFAQYGMQVGTHFLELKKYVEKEYVNPNAFGRQVFQARSAFPILQGLYFRACYHSVGTEKVVKFKTQFLVYE